MSGVLERVLLLVSSALLVPVLLLLVAGLCATLVLLGGFLREGLERRGQLSRWQALRHDGPASLRARAAHELPALARPLLVERPTGVDGALEHDALEVALDRRLGEAEEALARRVEPAALLCKVGPMLGLAGTLIPLGPALLGLQAGDMGSLGQNLAVAFTATVAGLAIAGPCFALATVRKRWYARDVQVHAETGGVPRAGRSSTSTSRRTRWRSS